VAKRKGGPGTATDRISSHSDLRSQIHEPKHMISRSCCRPLWRFGLQARWAETCWWTGTCTPPRTHCRTSVSAVVEIGDLDLAARCMVLGKERQMLVDAGEFVEVPFLADPCRYHEHRRLGQPCYKRSRDSVFSQLALMVRRGVGGWEDDDDDDDGDSGFEGEVATPEEYRDCVRESLGLLEGGFEVMIG
jgi:hypothetical protein